MAYTTSSKFTARNLLLFGVLLLGTSVLAVGCHIEIDDDYHHGDVDLEVSWNIDGEDSPDLCSDFRIDRWRVDVWGPEDRTTILDCRANQWNTARDLDGLYEGFYSVTVIALDRHGDEITSLTTDVDLDDDDIFQFVELDFFPQDF